MPHCDDQKRLGLVDREEGEEGKRKKKDSHHVRRSGRRSARHWPWLSMPEGPRHYRGNPREGQTGRRRRRREGKRKKKDAFGHGLRMASNFYSTMLSKSRLGILSGLSGEGARRKGGKGEGERKGKNPSFLALQSILLLLNLRDGTLRQPPMPQKWGGGREG